MSATTLPNPGRPATVDSAGNLLVADRIPAATILFSDIVDFTELAGHLAPERMIQLLGTLFAHFDALAGELGLEKIETLGDGYMAAAGVPEPRFHRVAPYVVDEFARADHPSDKRATMQADAQLQRLRQFQTCL